jgi:hypothetical protein
MYKNQTKKCQDLGLSSHSGNYFIGIYPVIILLVTVASILAVISLCFSFFDIPLIILGAVIISCGILRLSRARIKPRRFSFSYILICLITLFFLLRLDLYPHLMGGQDQGLYVNMAEMLIKNKGLNFQDIFRQSLNGEERVIYDQSFMASVFLTNNQDSIYSIAFYPLHPIWMAISKFFLGKGLHTLSLLFFSILGIVGGYYLSNEIFADKKAAIIAAFLLSVNPALVFFSKFPVSEIVAFAFSVNGFLFILKSVNSQENKARWLYWLIALLSFNCFFYVRMQFFIYIPFFCMLFFWMVLNRNLVKYEYKKKQLIISFIFVLFFTFALSLLFYFFFLRALFDGIVLGHLPSLLNRTTVTLTLIGLLSLFGIVFFPISPKPDSIIESFHNTVLNIFNQGERFIPWLLPISLLFSLPSIFHLYQGGVNMFFFGYELPTGTDISLIRYHVLYKLCLILSPIGLLILFITPFLNLSLLSKSKILILFLTTIWFSMLLQPWVPHLYYYGRYLVSEMVPYSLIFVAGVSSFIISSVSRFRAVGKFFLLLMGIYFFVFSIVQYGKPESEDSDFYVETLKYVSKSDILLASGLGDRQYVPLRIIYGLNIFPLTNTHGAQILITSEILEHLQAMARSKGGRLLILSSNQINFYGISKLTDLTFKNRLITNGEHINENGIYSPKKISTFFLPTYANFQTKTFSLYQVETPQIFQVFAGVCMPELNLTVNGINSIYGLQGFSGPEGHGRWSDGILASYKCKLPMNSTLPSKVYLEFTAFTPDEHKQKISVTLNNKTKISLFADAKNSSQIIEIPLLDFLPGEEVFLNFSFPNAISPKDLKISGDERMLGISIKTISFK